MQGGYQKFHGLLARSRVRFAPDPYRVLGVSRGVGAEELKKRYLEAAKKYHPDRNKNDPNAVKQFKEIQEAYEAIRDGRAGDSYSSSPGGPHRPGEGDWRQQYGGGGGPDWRQQYGYGGGGADWRARIAAEQKRRMDEEIWRRQMAARGPFSQRYFYGRDGPQGTQGSSGGASGSSGGFYNAGANQNEVPADPRTVDRMFLLWPAAFIVLLLLRGPPGPRIYIDELGRAVSFDGYGNPKYHPELDVTLPPGTTLQKQYIDVNELPSREFRWRAFNTSRYSEQYFVPENRPGIHRRQESTGKERKKSRSSAPHETSGEIDVKIDEQKSKSVSSSIPKTEHNLSPENRRSQTGLYDGEHPNNIAPVEDSSSTTPQVNGAIE
ncbi:unnamed protein product [Amoebophrya sp. A25]|nr:unnamed protein product [Amoebophrya sp. A25]|eukprot:GSA25T00005042001.1